MPESKTFLTLGEEIVQLFNATRNATGQVLGVFSFLKKKHQVKVTIKTSEQNENLGLSSCENTLI